mmetsp:Transcript_9582/g.25038  ORF Transcript_9582/g.25038 Transcript_9582/m.25038 type:complete len:486 (+) Transcript_9582:89-1546(+)|eukprot:CAMPEP_0117499590 /NCGR_PEP_ID=MMETSP0784-20121206/22323_1 /TAXON_ID=39447 /ORGANISM="" /LENGTH=485 /DNA_ID=CAMNT_0005294741 /DNA_START=89 /DNA_END=1546 /DNA_ORIENTATION=-
MSVNLLIKRLGTGTTTAIEFPIDVPTTSTVEELKEQIAGRVEIPQENIRLVCAGRVWENVKTICSYEVQDGAVVHCLNNPQRATPAPAAQTLQQSNPLQSMFGSFPPMGGGNGSGDPMQNMMAQAHQQMMQNPEMLQQMMNSPIMQQMMSNPETMRAMIRMNPQLNQLMEQRPEIARILEDPETLQQSMRMMSNPALMREMIRNQDRALGQLDVMPGGHAALANAHADLVDPLFAAMAGGDTGAMQSTNDYSQSTEGAPNTDALPNPWGGPARDVASTTPSVPTPAAQATAPTSTPVATAPAAPATSMTTPAMNPFAAMFTQPPAGATSQMQSFQGPGMAGMGGFGGMGGMGGGGMMQNMMSNPAAMQNVAQMMSNPAFMQQIQQMQQMFGGGMGGAAPPAWGAQTTNPNAAVTPGATGTPAPATSTPQVPPVNNAAATAMQRVRFASQLAQLSAMGFNDEALCLQALQQHNGRVDAAIDTLLSG